MNYLDGRGTPSKLNTLPHTAANSNQQRGFTLIELIAVIIVLGILAVTIMPRLQSRSAYDERLFTDELISTARYAQQQAMMRGSNVTVRLSIDNVGRTYGIEVDDGGGFQWITHANGRAFPHGFPNDMTVAPTPIVVSYNALGHVSANVQQQININAGARMFCIQATGYTHDGAC